MCGVHAVWVLHAGVGRQHVRPPAAEGHTAQRPGGEGTLKVAFSGLLH